MLVVELTGTDAAAFTSPASITVSPEKPGLEKQNPALTITTEADSTVSNTNVKGICPSLGEAWIELTAAGTTTTKYAKGEEVNKAASDFKKKDKTGLKMYRET
jgi:hypothetical protein